MSRSIERRDGVLRHDRSGRSFELQPYPPPPLAEAMIYETRRTMSRSLEMVNGVRMHDRSVRSNKLQTLTAAAKGGGDDM